MLLDTYNDANKVTDRELSVRYSSVLRGGGVVEYTRRATKSYRYVGMTHEAAFRCARVKTYEYTRDFARVGSDGAVTLVRECPTDIAMEHGEGSMWSVRIDVNETDVRLGTGGTDVDALFAAENERTYDGVRAPTGFFVEISDLKWVRDPEYGALFLGVWVVTNRTWRELFARWYNAAGSVIYEHILNILIPGVPFCGQRPVDINTGDPIEYTGGSIVVYNGEIESVPVRIPPEEGV